MAAKNLEPGKLQDGQQDDEVEPQVLPNLEKSETHGRALRDAPKLFSY